MAPTFVTVYVIVVFSPEKFSAATWMSVTFRSAGTGVTRLSAAKALLSSNASRTWRKVLSSPSSPASVTTTTYRPLADGVSVTSRLAAYACPFTSTSVWRTSPTTRLWAPFASGSFWSLTYTRSIHPTELAGPVPLFSTVQLTLKVPPATTLAGTFTPVTSRSGGVSSTVTGRAL